MKNLILLLLGIVIGFLICKFIFKPDTLTMTEPRGIITPDEAKVLDQAYNLRHQLISDSLVKKPDNRSSWWSLEDLRSYLNIAEKQASTLKYKMDGIRIYQGAYPITKDGEGLTTMFLVPTGTPDKAEGSMLNLNLQEGSGDIPGANPLNMGQNGNPPQANYPNH